MSVQKGKLSSLELSMPCSSDQVGDSLAQYNENVEVGINPRATIVAINPSFAHENFGIFTVPALDDLRNNFGPLPSHTLAVWGVLQGQRLGKKLATVPPETGRAVLLPNWTHPLYREILIKGTGPVERFINNNKLRDASRGFDGFLEISEAERDLVHSEILSLAGVRVAPGIGIVNHHIVQKHPTFTAWIGNYIRGFRSQLRISNLFEMDPTVRRKYIDIAISRIGRDDKLLSVQNYVDYFKTMIDFCARNVAIMQAIGFTQDSLHYGQITLCGEFVDFGIGSLQRTVYAGQVNTLHPWFRFERQPILVQNILYKTHAVKAEPHPVLLPRDSRAVQEQKTLFGAIRSFCKDSADEIEALKPEQRFWKVYNSIYRGFDLLRFKTDVLDRHSSYFQWEPEHMLAQIPAAKRQAVASRYREMLDRLNDHFETQIATWERQGSLAIHRQILFGQAVRQVLPGWMLNFSNENIGIWRSVPDRIYLTEDLRKNPLRDLTWQPQ